MALSRSPAVTTGDDGFRKGTARLAPRSGAQRSLTAIVTPAKHRHSTEWNLDGRLKYRRARKRHRVNPPGRADSPPEELCRLSTGPPGMRHHWSCRSDPHAGHTTKSRLCDGLPFLRRQATRPTQASIARTVDRRGFPVVATGSHSGPDVRTPRIEPGSAGLGGTRPIRSPDAEGCGLRTPVYV